MLGEGGFGKTFLAEDTQMPSRRLCVVKQLKPVTTNPELYKLVEERFQREAVILEKLGEKSNQIPSLYAYLSENGHFYLIQEWVEGSTLDNLIGNQNFLNEKNVREILVNLLPILEFIHAQGIIHRDIKPENIILRQYDNVPVLIDFGAVRETMGTLFNSKGNPTSSIVIGTPGYMASEQAAGRPIASSDLYSLGLTAIYLLTGKSPQELMTDSQSGEILWLHHAHDLSSEIVEILSKATRSHPRDRYSSASEMLLDLLGKSKATNSKISTQQVPRIGLSNVPPSNTVYASNTNSNQGRSLLVLGGLIATGLIGSVIGITSFLTRITPQASLSGNSIVASPSSLPIQENSP
ncbi:MAG: protein kinase domain-containing protein, partial [Pseudanabaena sp.]